MMPTVAGIHPSQNTDRERLTGKRTADSQIKDIPLHSEFFSGMLIYFISINQIACVVSAVIFVATSCVSP